MGQTLTHGIYLPDEGERNCYSGLAANWQILDNSVGTIAAHTAALSGKAPLVHTHSKSDITDFPAYGTTAGTICEGNDSRLSDARTPVAHTHTKSDVTDLFNSANTWSGEQTFSQTIHGNADTATEFASNQSVTLTGTIEGTASSKAGWTIATDFREGRGARTTTDFYAKLASGSVSRGWNVYVATFMCNASERFETALVQICFMVNQQGIVEATNGVQIRIRSINGLVKTRFVLVYKNDTNKVLFELYAYNPSANQGILAQLLNEFIRNNNKQSVSIQTYSGIIVNALPDGYTAVNAETALTANDFIPSSNNAYELGTSTNRWKTLNGVNPGLLSIPNMGTSAAIAVDITSWYIQDPDDPDNPNAKIIDDSVEHTVRSNVPGWIFISIPNVSGNYAYARQSVTETNMWSTRIADGLASNTHVNVDLIFPIINSLNVRIKAKSAVVRIFTCLGNV